MDHRDDHSIRPRGLPDLDTLILDAADRADAEADSPRRFASVIHRRRWLMFAIMAVVVGLGTVYTLTRPPVYESSAMIVVVGSQPPAPVQQDDVPLLGDLQALTRSRSVDTQLQIMSSPDLLQAAFDSLDPRLRAEGFGASRIPAWSYSIASRKQTDVIEVTARAYTSTAAAALANTIVDTYFERDQQQNNRATRQVRGFAEQKMATAERELDQANVELARYKQETGLFAPDTQLAKTAEQVAILNQSLDEARAQMRSSRYQADALRDALAAQKQDVVTNTTIMRNPQYSASLQRIDELNSERATLLQEYTPESPEVRAVEGRIAAEETKLKRIADTIVGSTTQARNPVRDTLLTQYAGSIAAASAAAARVGALEVELRIRQDQAGALPERERGLAERLQKVALLQRTYDMLSSKYYALLLREQATLPNGMLISQARIPDDPAYPQTTTNAVLFVAVGVALALAAAMIAERFDQRIHDQALVERLSGLPTLSLVPDSARQSPRLIDNGAGHGPLLESYRILRNSIAFSGVERRLRVIAVTSPGRREGKSTTSVNLAVAMAMEGKRVLLVDADLRRPSLHTILGLSRETGLSSVLVGEATLEQCIADTGTQNLWCLPSGPPALNSAELLASARCREVFAELCEKFEAVIIDCPPTTGLSDVQSVATFADGVLLVVSMDRTLKPNLTFTIRMLMQAGAPLIGLVLNRIDATDSAYSHYYDCCTYDGAPDAPSARHEAEPRRN